MVLQLKTEYQKSIALRAAARTISNDITSVIKSIDEMVEEAGTKTAHRVTHVQARKFADQASQFIKLAVEGRKSKSNTEYQFALEEAFLDTQKSAIEQRRRLNTEMTNHPGTIDTYQAVFDKLIVLSNLRINAISSINFDKKSEAIATQLFTLTTLNKYAELVRVSELSNKSIVAKYTLLCERPVDRAIQSKEDVINLVKSNPLVLEKTIKEITKEFYLNQIAPEVTAFAQSNAKDIFEVESDPEEFKKLLNLLSDLSNKNASSSYVIGDIVKGFKDSLLEKYKELANQQ